MCVDEKRSGHVRVASYHTGGGGIMGGGGGGGGP